MERTEKRENRPATEHTEPTEPTDATLANEPSEPIDQELPIEPMLKELPIDPIEQNDPIEPIDRALPIEPRDRHDPWLVEVESPSSAGSRSGLSRRGSTAPGPRRIFPRAVLAPRAPTTSTAPAASRNANFLVTCFSLGSPLRSPPREGRAPPTEGFVPPPMPQPRPRC